MARLYQCPTCSILSTYHHKTHDDCIRELSKLLRDRLHFLEHDFKQLKQALVAESVDASDLKSDA
jgi:hypothetical protein